MINVPQDRIEVEKLINQFPKDSIQMNIISKIDKSPIQFNYKSLKDLEFEVNLRASIINSSRKLLKSGMDFAVFRQTICNTDFWIRNNDGGFKLKQGIKASDAIEDIFLNGKKYSTECATAIVIIYYKAILDVYPKELFNETFKEITLMNWHYLDKNLSQIGLMNNLSADIPGDRRYFKNPDVNLTTPEWQGENVIDLGNGKYYGHGAGIDTADKIIEMLNENRKEGASVSAYLMDSAGNPKYRHLSEILNKYNAKSEVLIRT